MNNSIRQCHQKKRGKGERREKRKKKDIFKILWLGKVQASLVLFQAETKTVNSDLGGNQNARLQTINRFSGFMTRVVFTQVVHKMSAQCKGKIPKLQ